MERMDFESIVKQLRPDDVARLIGVYFEISGLPSNLSRVAVNSLLRVWTSAEAVWPMDRVSNGFRNWIVRAPAPYLSTRIQASFGVVSIEKPRESKRPTLRVFRPMQKQTPCTMPKAWIADPPTQRSSQTPSASAPRTNLEQASL